MKVADTQVAVEERLRRLWDDLDLFDVKMKIMESPPEGKGWTQEQANSAETWYKRYLHVIIKYPKATQHVPNGPIDAFWHQHILDTQAYARDCEHVLGYFLHHYPYFGLKGDAADRDAAFEETCRLYQMEFGEDCRDMFSDLELVASGSNCNSSGSGTGCGQRGCKGGK